MYIYYFIPMKKKNLALLFFTFVLSLALASCESNQDVQKISITLQSERSLLYVGETLQLLTDVKPESQAANLEWQSSDSEVVSVNNHGLAKALKPGEAVIMVKAGNVSVSSSITVKEFVAVESVTFPEDGYKVFLGEPLPLEPKVSPENAAPLRFQWSVENSELASVDENGNIVAKKVGDTTLKLVLQDKTYECPLLIRDHIRILNEDLKMVVGAQLLLRYDPDFAKGEDGNGKVDVTVGDMTKLLAMSQDEPRFIAIHEGTVSLSLTSDYAETHTEVEIAYPDKLFPAFVTWEAGADEVKAWEEQHNGQVNGSLEFDSGLGQYVLQSDVKTSQVQPISLRKYAFEKDGETYSLQSSSVYYPYVICFDDRGGGFGNFSSEFLALLKQEGFGTPENIGANTFIAINKEKKITLILSTDVIGEMPMIVLTYQPKLW